MDWFSRTYTVDWMAKAKYFVALSIILMLVGGTAWYRAGSLPYGVDFRGGTVVYVRFAQEPPIDSIRQGLAAQGLGDSQIQKTTDLARPDANEVVIILGQQGEGEQALDAGKNAILQSLSQTFGSGEADKKDLNAATQVALAEFLMRRDPLGASALGSDRYTELARAILSYRDSDRSGLMLNFDELRNVPEVTDAVLATLRGDYYLGSFAVRNVEIVGPRVGAQLRRQAVLATLYALAGMLVYIAFRFAGGPVATGRTAPSGLLGGLGSGLARWIDRIIFGAAAVLAVSHDVLITLGFFSVFKFEISLTVIVALLTLVGYSMNDKIVIFDRIRENLRLMRREPLAHIVNVSINQTLSRTFLTGGMTFAGLVILLFLGGEVLRGFAFALVAGIVVGTYSSFGIAAPVVVAWHNLRGPKSPGVAAPRTRPSELA